MLQNPAQMLVESFLANKTIDKIYSGADNACRCGCRGKYYEADNRMFKSMLKKVMNKVNEGGVEIHHCEDCGVEWINISYGDNRAYTIYVK